MSSWNSGGLPDGVKDGIVIRDELHESMWRSFVTGLRTGVPVTTLDGHRAFSGIDGLVMFNENRARVELLRQELSEAERLAKSARGLAIREQDPRQQLAYQAEARAQGARAEALSAAIDRAHEQVAGGVPPVFTCEMSFFEAGLSALLTPSGVVEQSVWSALRKVLHNMTGHFDDTWFHWEASLLLPADGNVYVAGPFAGRVPRHGRVLTPAERDRAQDSNGGALRRRQLIEELTQAGYPRRIARAATLAPDLLLAKVLLGVEIHWPDCTPDFEHQGFNNHLRSVWTSLMAWDATKYCQVNPKRQTLTDLVAAMDGHARRDQLRPVLTDFGLNEDDLHPMTLTRVSRGGAPDWSPSVRRTGPWTAASLVHQNGVESVYCPVCGQPATAVVRVPEVPGSLLCRSCLRPPAAPDLVFPPVWRELALPSTVVSDSAISTMRAVAPGGTAKGRKPAARADSVDPHEQ